VAVLVVEAPRDVLVGALVLGLSTNQPSQTIAPNARMSDA
jgi:hypothetical protein